MPPAQYSSNGPCPSRPLLVSLITTCPSPISGPVIAFLVGLTATDKTKWGDGSQMPSATEVVTFPANVCWILRVTAFLLNRTFSTTWKHVMLLVVANVLLFEIEATGYRYKSLTDYCNSCLTGSPLQNARVAFVKSWITPMFGKRPGKYKLKETRHTYIRFSNHNPCK